MKSKLKELVAKHERETGQRLLQNEIAEITGINHHTISRWMSPRPMRRIDADVVEPLMRLFKCRLDDLVYIDYETSA